MKKIYEVPEEESTMTVGETMSSFTPSAPSLPFSVYQMQILDSIASVKTDEEMRDIRDLIAEYFSNKALDAIDKLCDDGVLSTEIIESWHNEHLRTPYQF